MTGNTPAPTVVRLPGVTDNTTAPLTIVNNICAALRSVSVNVRGGRGPLISSEQAVPAIPTTTNFARESGDTCSPMAAALAFDERQKHLVGGAGTSVSLSSGTV